MSKFMHSHDVVYEIDGQDETINVEVDDAVPGAVLVSMTAHEEHVQGTYISATDADGLGQALIAAARAANPDLTSQAVEKVLADVRAERATHAGRGYDAQHDDEHGVHHLVSWSANYIARSRRLSDSGRMVYVDRQRLVQAASLLIAAIETIDRAEA